LHCAPLAHRTVGTFETGTVRLSVSAFNTEKEIAEFLVILRKIMNRNS
ncbi:MAG: cysteine desulfurase, partial [Oscillospiraceae bacterium]|nr:cysteine desulfurase [Oscillospiraceae bacterium]